MTDAPIWSVRLLDHFQLSGPSGATTLSSRKAIALLAYLALQRDFVARRDVIANLLWEDVETTQARVNLRQAVAALRKLEADGLPLIESDLDTIRLSPGLITDAHLFERLSVGSAPDRLAAADLYKTDLLAGFALRDAPAFNEWLGVAQAHWRQRMVGLLLSIAEEGGDDLNGGISAALRLLSIDPFNEAGHRSLMRLYTRQGRSARAVAQYRALSEMLRHELDIVPEAETRQLYDALKESRRRRDGLAPVLEKGAAPAPEPAVARAKHIAVVDDEANLRDAVATYLRLHGFEVSECASGMDLDRILDCGDLDLILLDVTMPGEDGFAIARRLRGEIPTIMLTARSDLVDRVVGLELGADDYIVKPYELREVVARVRAVLRRAEGASAAE